MGCVCMEQEAERKYLYLLAVVYIEAFPCICRGTKMHKNSNPPKTWRYRGEGLECQGKLSSRFVSGSPIVWHA